MSSWNDVRLSEKMCAISYIWCGSPTDRALTTFVLPIADAVHVKAMLAAQPQYSITLIVFQFIQADGAVTRCHNAKVVNEKSSWMTPSFVAPSLQTIHYFWHLSRHRDG